MLGGGRKGPGEVVDFSVNIGADITPQPVMVGEVVDFSVDLTKVQPASGGNVKSITKGKIVNLFRGFRG